MDAQARAQAITAGGWDRPAPPSRDRGSGGRLQEPHRCRQAAWADPEPVRTHAAAHDVGELTNPPDASNMASPVWADTTYRSAANLAALAKRGLTARRQRPRPRGKPIPPNVRRDKIRAAVEHVFAC